MKSKVTPYISMIAALFFAASAQAQQAAEEPMEMGFFVTSVGVGDGGNLGGLAGADAHCQSLAEEAGAGHRTWRAYLSTQATDSTPAVHARDRIGEGPWANANGVVMAASLDDLMYNNANLHYDNSIDEEGDTVNSGAAGDEPNRHDVLTGTELDGTAPDGDEDLTCGNWTSNSDGRALVGHHDRFRRTTPGSPWNNAHPSRGCSQENLQASGGDGLFYCFAEK
ncbi:MAG: lectin [Woeseiaceae bacterium]